METILAIITGTVLGAVVGIVFARSKSKELQNTADKLKWQLDSERANAEQAAVNFRQQIATAKSEAKEQIETIKAECEKRIAEAKSDAEKQSREAMAAQEKRHEQATKAQQELFDETMEKVTAQVKSATDEMLKQRQKEFAESSNTNLGQIVTPLRETIEKMKQTMSDNTLKHAELSSEMKANLENMMKHSVAAKESADELARVFKHRSKVQGDWGERVLGELLESQGLTQGVHYEMLVETPDGYEIQIQDYNSFDVGSEVGMMIKPADIHVMRKERTENHVEGVMVDSTHVSLLGETFECKEVEGVSAGDKVDVAFDFGAVELTDDADDGTSWGTIRFILYKGDRYHLTVRTDEGENIYVDTHDVWEDLDEVGIKLSPEALRITPHKG
jgi:DNA recombination protein RmuC